MLSITRLVGATSLVIVLTVICGLTAAAFPPVDYGATNVTMKLGSIIVGGDKYQRMVIEGSGDQWRNVSGVPGIWVSSGDDYFVAYQNELNSPSIIHGHGLTPPSNLDGVPFISALPIRPNHRILYRYRMLPQNAGTHMAHSHYAFQHGLGLSYPVVVEGDAPDDYPLKTELEAATDAIMFLEDFCPYFADAGPSENPDCFDPEIVFEELQASWNDSQPFNYTECMPPGEDTDVLFKHHLANGRTMDDPLVINVAAGQVIRLRTVSSTSMSNYYIESEMPETVLVAVDGQYVNPYPNTTFWISVAQRIDLLITAPTENGAYLVSATTEGISASLTQRSGIVFVVGGAEYVPPPGTYSVQTSPPGFMTFSLEKELRAFYPLDARTPDREYTIKLTGDNGFKSINGVSYQLPPVRTTPFDANPNPLVVRSGERVCITMINHNADPHSMHLHQHQFQVVEINGEAVQGAMRDTLLMPGGDCNSAKICFDANNPGIAPLHCHMLYHLAAGMLTTVEYAP